MPEGHLCCGSAGTYNLLQPEIAGALRDRKVANIARTAPELVAAGNIGCITQIAAGDRCPWSTPSSCSTGRPAARGRAPCRLSRQTNAAHPLRFGSLVLEAELRDTPTAAAIAANLPYEAQAMTWGDEVYFDVPFARARGRRARFGGSRRDRLLAGRPSIAIGFGRTPISRATSAGWRVASNIFADATSDVTGAEGRAAGNAIAVTLD